MKGMGEPMEEEAGDADGTLSEVEEPVPGYALKQDVFYHLRKPHILYYTTTEKTEMPEWSRSHAVPMMDVSH
jgi:hypothetical protein